MKVNLTAPNLALVSIIKDPSQVITLDANFLIPPSRGQSTKGSIGFEKYITVWLAPIFSIFPKLAIHEAVYEELISTSSRAYIDDKLALNPPRIVIHKDSSLNEIEKVLRDTIELKFTSHTRYDPLLDNKDDRGEVKSLSYIAVKGLPFFAAHDNNAIQLIEKSEEWSTGLDNVQAIKNYELLYYLYKNNSTDKKSLRMLYKYQYYLTKNEKETNPEWGEFISSMDALYEPYFK